MSGCSTVKNGTELNSSYLLVTPISTSINRPFNYTYLVDRKLKVVKKWSYKLLPLTGQLDTDGNLYVVGAKIKEKNLFRPGMTPYLQKISPENKLLWSHHDPMRHHDFKILKNKNILYGARYSFNYSEAKKYMKVKPYKGLAYGEQIIELNPISGKPVWNWYAHKHINLFEENKIPKEKLTNLMHINSVDYTDSFILTGRPSYMVSARSSSRVYVIDKKSKKIVWESPDGFFIHQHAAQFLNNGNLLVFDNRLNEGKSKVVEYSFLESKIVWEYFGGGFSPFDKSQFFSGFMSGAQRRQNGNTVITLGSSGYVVEVNQDKKIQWEFINNIEKKDQSLAWPFKPLFFSRMYDKF